MRATLSRGLLLGLLVGGLACSVAAPPSLPAVKSQLVEYVVSGRYGAAVDQIFGRAQRYLERQAPTVERPAMILDIDETTLSNWPNQRDSRFCYDPAVFHAWVLLAEAEALPGVLELYRTATRLGVTVFFVTGRHEDERAATEENLRAVGLDAWAALDMRPRNDGEKSAAVFKTAVRRRITETGYTVLVNIGDQQSDLSGGYAERSFKLPNPFYEVP